MENISKHIVVVGAGISGLCTAYWLKKSGFNVTVFESDSEPGGTMKTIRKDGWLIETGPNSALETTPLLRELFDQLKITDQLLYANDTASKRFIVRNSMLNVLPMGLGSFLSTRLWSTGGKLRLLKEPFIKKALKEESIAEFVTRRLGKEFLDYAINPFVAGVYAGSPEKLSVQSAFPKLYALEANYGSLMKGAIKSSSERKKRKEIAKDRARLFSFSNGMQTLPNRLAEALGDSLQFSTQVEHVVPMRVGRYPKYTISITHNAFRTSVEADAVVLSTPAYVTSKIIKPIDPEMASMLDAIYYPPVTEIFLGFERDQIKRPLDGFGFLVPEIEKKNILGCIWSSSLFPNRAPDKRVALTSFVGGSR
ncbi:MAG TPA: protoporphyrinogen oxidase, partial [Bacteroidota bacterium]|nr:protoporphyrinogen oxidase [Bacteroidota bacterium]